MHSSEIIYEEVKALRNKTKAFRPYQGTPLPSSYILGSFSAFGTSCILFGEAIASIMIKKSVSKHSVIGRRGVLEVVVNFGCEQDKLETLNLPHRGGRPVMLDIKHRGTQVRNTFWDIDLGL
jgi:hypothetical protein